MAKRRNDNQPDKEPDGLLAAASKENPIQLRELRETESKLQQAQIALRLEENKRQQAEQDLAESRERESLLLATQEKFGKIKARRGRKKLSKPPAVPIVCATDWHAEATVDPRVVNDLNAFDLTVFKRRVSKLWEKAAYLIDLWRQVSDIKEAVLWLGGDLVSGTIHPELEELNSLGPCEAIVEVQNNAATGINELLDIAGIEKLLIVTSNGNHGRITQKTRISTGYRHSLEWLAYNNLASHFKHDSRVAFQIGVGYHNYVDILGHTVRFHHGDQMRFFGGVGGLSIPAMKCFSQWNKSRRAELDVTAHYHQFIDMWNWVACGCLVGLDAYALSVKVDFQPPTQTFIVIDEQYGKCCALPIFVGS